ncbi:hypothetical protein [Bradyrhizobium canariense]|uniref:Uncharacterized protein n=1 Tax=Bradyrhizobium canariense TaxID=255045 RepID=A0A1H2BN11_9BRAD|nr:hypothetical protein [Bradyrhizobium canariense]SDT59504.1 hypothetical protein SAMN05444158_7350 [Bradyrhizobium canariense]
MANFRGKFRFGFIRILTATCGICSIAWAISSIPVYRTDAAFASAAQHILSGEKYTPDQLNILKLRLEATPASLLGPLALSNIVVIRLQMAITELASGNAQLAPSGLGDLDTAVTATLAENPTNSFLWLTEYWLQDVRDGKTSADPKLLRMSYLLGPNEGWIALRRSPVTLSVFSSLPDDLAEKAVTEFAGLVRSGFYVDAANILAGPGWAVHDKLLASLAPIDEGGRRWFAKVLESKNVEGVTVPGVDDKRSRPF